MKNKGVNTTRLGRKLTLMVAVAIVISFVSIAGMAYLLYRGVNDQATADQAATVFTILQQSNERVQEELLRTDKALSVSDGLAGAIVTRTHSSVESIFNGARANEDIQASFFNARGDVIWSTEKAPEGYDSATALAGETVTDLYKTANGELAYRCMSPVYSNAKKTTVTGGYVLEYNMASTALVDGVKAQAGVEATVFAGNTRIATTILDETGNRAVGTKMADNVAQRVLEQGEVYTAEAQVLGNNLQVYYEPLKNSGGEVLGALFTGMPLEAIDQRFLKSVAAVSGTALALAIIIVLLVVYILRKYVFKPLAQVSAVMQEISSGNLHTEHVKLKRDDEFGDLARDMNIMVTQLQTYIDDITKKVSAMAEADYTVRTGVDYIGDFGPIDEALKNIRTNMGSMFATLNDSAEQVYSGSMQMSQTAQLLAEGSATQAGTIEELSASIEEIATNVNESAENIQQMSKLYTTVDQRIDEQDRHMDDVLTAMRDIEENSAKIQNIIRTIEDIAFQTNILALNAAVEAARAGASGKGFAVVAEEVRSLAAKSAEAAKETTELISSTISSVEKGSDVARSAADAIKEVVELSRQTEAIIEDVSQKSEEQAESLRQVTVGLDQISSVVQQNSASSQESSAASVELSTQSFALRDVINKSKV